MQNSKLQLKIQNFKLWTATFNFKLLTLNSCQRRAGFGIIETIVAVSILIIIAVTGTTTVLHSFSVNRLGDEETEATLFAQEGIETTRSIKNQGWDDPFLATDCSSGCGIDSGGGSWAFSGTSDTLSVGSGRSFTRQIVVSEVQRDGNGDIVESGGTVDGDTKKVTSTVTWNFSPTRSNTVEVVSYLTHWEKIILSGGCNWSQSLSQVGSYNTVNVDNGGENIQADARDIFVVDNRAYLVTNNATGGPGGTNQEFFILDISEPDSPVELDSLDIRTDINRVFVSGNYAYLATQDDSKEMIVVKIENDTAVEVDSFDADGIRAAKDVYIDGSYAYLVRAQGAKPELYIIPLSDPENLPTHDDPNVGSLDTLGGLNGVTVSGNFVYIASSRDIQELVVVDIGDSPTASKTNPELEETLDLPRATDAMDITTDGAYLYIVKRASGQTEEFFAVKIGDIQGTNWSVEIGYDVRAVVLSGDYALLAVQQNANGFKIIDIANPESPQLHTTLNFGDPSYGVASAGCYAYAANSNNTEELKVVSNTP